MRGRQAKSKPTTVRGRQAKLKTSSDCFWSESRSWKVGTGMPVSPFGANIYNSLGSLVGAYITHLGHWATLLPSSKHCSSIGSPLCEGRPGHHNNLLRERERGERERGRGRQRGGEGGEERGRVGLQKLALVRDWGLGPRCFSAWLTFT